MDAGIADTINRQDARLVAEDLDSIDRTDPDARPWYLSSASNVMLAADYDTNPDRAWHFGILASGIPGLHFDGEAADGDWENLFSHFRAEIMARRDPETPHADAAETRNRVVV